MTLPISDVFQFAAGNWNRIVDDQIVIERGYGEQDASQTNAMTCRFFSDPKPDTKPIERQRADENTTTAALPARFSAGFSSGNASDNTDGKIRIGMDTSNSRSRQSLWRM
jgi:hypothetical protein